jgi:NADPH-dependent 2,4-dienoyl-CoA reductase/sulfur reductase-like enzyme
MRYADTKPFEDSFWDDRRIERRRGWVVGVDTDARRLELHDGSTLGWDRLLVASGSQPSLFGWPGQDLPGVQGLYGLPDLAQLYANTASVRQAVIVGGGLIGIELAEMLHSRNIPVRFLVRERSYWDGVLPAEESRMINDVIRSRGIALELETELGGIEADGAGRAAAAVASDGRRFDCQLVGLTAGVRPNVGFLRGSGVATGRGVLVDDRLRAGAPGVWAAGDCAEIVVVGGSLIQQVWYTGKMQGEVAGDNIGGADRRYDPGIWFNSAKFFDVEYQTYGQVRRNVPGERNLYWEDRQRRRAARIVYTGDGVIGLQALGLRWRHAVAERWLRERRPVAHVLERLDEIAFDPEFEPREERAIARALREQLA